MTGFEILLEEANRKTVEELSEIYKTTGTGFVANGGKITEVVEDGTDRTEK